MHSLIALLIMLCADNSQRRRHGVMKPAINVLQVMQTELKRQETPTRFKPEVRELRRKQSQKKDRKGYHEHQLVKAANFTMYTRVR